MVHLETLDATERHLWLRVNCSRGHVSPDYVLRSNRSDLFKLLYQLSER